MRLAPILLSLSLAGSCLAPATALETDVKLLPGGRARANSWYRMSAPPKTALIDIHDPWGRRIWTGATRDGTFTFLTRDWADGQYTVRFTPSGTEVLTVETEYYESVRARAGLMLREIEALRDADGLPPERLRPASDLLQRVVTEYVQYKPKDAVEGDLYNAELALGFRTEAATVLILGSGSATFTGYDEPYRPFLRERSSVFVPPNAVFDFAANAARKLKRWGYTPADVEHIFISHSHADHFNEAAIAELAVARRSANLPPVTVHAGRASCRRLEGHLSERGLKGVAVLDLLEPGGVTEAGELRVKAVRARHAADSDPLCYIIRLRGATIYYGTDTGYPFAETLAALSAERFDVFIHELTVASAEDFASHCDTGDLRMLVGKLRRAGAVDHYTRVVTFHQDHAGQQGMPDLPYWQAMIGYESGYDGMPVPVAFRSSRPLRP